MRDELCRKQEQLDKTQKSLKGMADDRDWWRDEAMRLKGNHRGLYRKPFTCRGAALAASADLQQQATTADLQRDSIRRSSIRSCQHLLEATVIRDAIATAADNGAEADQENQEAEGQWDSDLVWQEAVAAGRKQNLKRTTKDNKLKH